MDVFTFALAEPMPDSDVLHWVEETELERYAVPMPSSAF